MNVVFDKAAKDIYNHYPRNKIWGTQEYYESIEYKNLQYKSSISNLSILANESSVLLKKVVVDYTIIPWSNFELYTDVEFKILLHKGQNILDDDIELLDVLKGLRRDLYIYISAIGCYYYLYFEQTQLMDGQYLFNKIETLTEEERILKNKIIESFSNACYIKIDSVIANIILPDIQTELKGFGKARVFDCLFNDIKAHI